MKMKLTWKIDTAEAIACEGAILFPREFTQNIDSPFRHEAHK